MSETIELAVREPMPVARPALTSIDILEAAVKGGITSENVAVVRELVAMRREESAEESRKKFNRAYFELRNDLKPIYADKEVRTKSGTLAFSYCTPQEIKEMLEPLLQKHGFCTMLGQELKDGMVTVSITLLHKDGHSETRNFTARVSPGNNLTTPTQCDAGATTAAERHLLIKMFGIRTRANDTDARNLGDTINEKEAADLEMWIDEVDKERKAQYLSLAGAQSFGEIKRAKYEVLLEILKRKVRR